MLVLWIKEFFFCSCRRPKPRTWNIKSPVSNQGSYWKSLTLFTVEPPLRPPKMWRMNSRLREFIAYENQFTGVSSEKSPNTSTTWKRIYCMQFLNYDTCICGFKLLLKVLPIHWVTYSSTFPDQSNHTMPQVVAYKGLKTMENYKTVSPKVVAVVYENSNYQALFGKL